MIDYWHYDVVEPHFSMPPFSCTAIGWLYIQRTIEQVQIYSPDLRDQVVGNKVEDQYSVGCLVAGIVSVGLTSARTLRRHNGPTIPPVLLNRIR